MKTKDFIKMLHEADPSGEAHIRLPDGGIPVYAELKEGYWDGPYSYFDDDGNYVYSSEDLKLDLYSTDIWDFVNNHTDEKTTWEEIKNRFIFKLTGYCESESKNRKINTVLQEAKEAYDFASKMEKEMLEESIQRAIQRAKDGWTFFQNKQVDLKERGHAYVYYQWRLFPPTKRKSKLMEMFSKKEKQLWEPSSLGDTEGLLKSGLFEKIDNNKLDGYYEWILKK